VAYVEGGRTASGFFSVEEMEYPVRMYCIHPNSQSITFETVSVSVGSLDHSKVLLLDDGKELYVWHGERARKTFVTRTRLAAEKINKDERKNEAAIFEMVQGKENPKWGDFWAILGVDHEDETIPEGYSITERSKEFVEQLPRLYRVGLGMGYLELPQVELPENKLVKKCLLTKNVFILDCFYDVFVWVGRRSTRLVRAAAMKLSQELLHMIDRPHHATTTVVKEGTESMVFKSKFTGWNDVIGVDFTRTAESVRKTGPDLKDWASRQEVKTDLSALFTLRTPMASLEEATQCMEDWNDDLDSMESFVLEGKNFVKLPENEHGHFFSGECYVFLCRYWASEVLTEDNESDNRKDAEEPEEEYTYVVYFWQGRDASNMGWLTFCYTLRKKFMLLFGDKLEIAQMYQQQERPKFMAHFNRKFIIHTGNRKRTPKAASPKEASQTPTSELSSEEEEEDNDQLEEVDSDTETHDDEDKISVQPVKVEPGTVPLPPPPPPPGYMEKKLRQATKKNRQSKQSKVKSGQARSTMEETNSLPSRAREESPPKPPVAELFHMRSNGSPVFTRCLQVRVDARLLNSAFCYILKVPFGGAGDSGIVYVWLGESSDPEEARLCEEIADAMYDPECYSLQVIREGEEPDNFFWACLGGREKAALIDKEAGFMAHTRLFRCSNDKGFFAVSEKCTDFCQDDLADDDTMILDDGTSVFLWLGSKASEVEIKLALKSAQVYVQNLRVKEPSRPRKLLCTFKGKESRKFTRCFHGWAHFKSHAGA